MEDTSPAWYLNTKHRLINLGYADEIDWSNDIKPPASPEVFWREFAWVVLNSGMKNQIAQKIWDKVRPAVESGQSASTVFGHKGKSGAIDQVWRDRVDLHFGFVTADDKVAYCETLPWIGGITKWHLAKNLGVDCAKPDRHLVRIAGAEGAHALCERLSKATGDRIATVDVVIWRAANLGLV